MMLGRVRSDNAGGRPYRHLLMLYLSLLFFGWIVLMFVVIPWDTSGHLPQGSFELIEGERAYAMVVRKQRPTLATTIRGLNMVGAQSVHGRNGEERFVRTGNVLIHFDQHGEFLRLDILKEPVESTE